MTSAHLLSAIFVLFFINLCQANWSVTIQGRKFPKDFCSGDDVSENLEKIVNLSRLSTKIAGPLIRFMPDICRMTYLFNEGMKHVTNELPHSADSSSLFNVFAKSPDLREYCRLPDDIPMDHGVQQDVRKTPCKEKQPGAGKAWQQLRIFSLQTCILLYVMCVCCYAYGRIISLSFSPSTRLRRLNWTKENFIWAYKNF